MLGYSEKVDKIFSALFHSPTFPKNLANTIIRCFHLLSAEGTPEAIGEVILNSMLAHYTSQGNHPPFQLVSFFQRHPISKEEKRKILTAMLYGIYYKDFPLHEWAPEHRKNATEWLMVQLIAESGELTTLRQILSTLSLDHLVRLACFCHKWYREGSYLILRELPLLPHGKTIKGILEGLDSHYYEIDKCCSFVSGREKITEEEVKGLLAELEAYASERKESLFSMFNTLTALMHQRKPLKQYSEAYYSPSEFQTFVRFFGLEGHAPIIRYQKKALKENGLVEKIHALKIIFSHDILIEKATKKELRFYYTFIQEILNHLNAFLKSPEKVLTGLKKTAFAIPTMGKELEKFPSLASLIQGIALVTESRLNKHPVFVFDQSDDLLFETNSLYIDRLNKKQGAAIVHLSRQDTVALAKKLDVDRLIQTTTRGTFGYGGARNAVSFLAPVLKLAFEGGCRKVSDVLALDTHHLRELFQAGVLGSRSPKNSGVTIFSLDDDVAIAPCNVFSHLLFAEEHETRYYKSEGYTIGRATKFSVAFMGLKKLLSRHQRVFEFTKWIDYPIGAGMSEYVFKPTFCLNIPFGAEEAHLRGIEKSRCFIRTSYHLATARHPKGALPTHFFVGLEEHLKGFIPYAITLAMTLAILDPTNKYKIRAIPWNKKGALGRVSSLRTILMVVGRGSTKEELRAGVWRNVKGVFGPDEIHPTMLRKNLDELINTDVDEVLEGFKKGKKLHADEVRSLGRIGALYKNYQQDARYLQEFGSLLMAQPGRDAPAIEQAKAHMEGQYGFRFSDYPLTEGFYLLLLAAGAGQFCDIINNICHEEA